MTQEEVAEISMTNNQVEENDCLKKCKNKVELCNNNHKVGWKANTMDENIKDGSIIAIAGVPQANGTTKNTESIEGSDNSDDDEMKENEASPIIAKGKHGWTKHLHYCRITMFLTI